MSINNNRKNISCLIVYKKIIQIIIINIFFYFLPFTKISSSNHLNIKDYIAKFNSLIIIIHIIEDNIQVYSIQQNLFIDNI